MNHNRRVSDGPENEMEDVAQALYLVIFMFAVYGAILLLSRRKPPPGWKLETYEKTSNSMGEPLPRRKPDSFLKDDET